MGMPCLFLTEQLNRLVSSIPFRFRMLRRNGQELVVGTSHHWLLVTSSYVKQVHTIEQLQNDLIEGL